ncbi:hypothetical protein PYW08_008803 [Mythimna loreyi]|uniref:Uncharacterized protein n=1 Tax=Mythimna loreyi TaxID=667449 RepID=A0ACC2QBH2_9NEOP|nr:hypothetical protein PYW08_008803 [Mythimna loreyi]
MEKMKTVCLLICVIVACSEGAKILVVFPMPSRSHGNLGDGYVRHLLKAGHEVTYITPFKYKNAPANLRTIDVSSNFDVMNQDTLTLKNFMAEGGFDVNPAFMIFLMVDLVKHTVENKEVQKLLIDPKEQFDAVVIEWMFSDVIAGFASMFQSPLIWASSVDPHWQVIQLIDEPPNPAYSVDAMSPYFPPLSFSQRVKELWNQLKVHFFRVVWLDSVEINAYTSTFTPIAEKRGIKLPAYEESRYNASLVLSNAYVTTSGGASLPQSHKFIGGYHIDDTVKPLPEDLKTLMDSAKEGVIYFSMGSNLRSKDLPEEVKVNLLKMFGSLKQTVLWKFEEVLPNLPKNVHILEWAPQQAILAHPNLAVFITHGGLLSTTESIHFGVPIIGIPVFGDQFMNVEKSVNKGFALRVDLAHTMPDELKKKIVEVTSNKRYAEKAKELSFIHHDRPVTPGQELVHWVNHVINTRGAPHLRSPALDLPFYKRKFLDLAALIVVLLLAVYVLLKQMEKIKTIGLLLSIILACSEAAKILVVFPLPSRSHANLGDGYVKHLLKAGHEVTYITPIPYKNAPANLRTFDVSKNFDVLPQEMMSLKTIMDTGGFGVNPALMVFMMVELVKKSVENEEVQKLLIDPNEQFDAVIVEWMFSDIVTGFASVFQCPLILSSSVDPHWQIIQLIDEPLNPAYAVNTMSPYFPPLSFLQRVNELWIQMKDQFMRYVWLDGVEEKAYTSIFSPIAAKRGIKLPTYDEVRYNASLVLSNAYVTTSGGASLPQSHKFIGGYHIDDTVIPLPEDLKKLMDSAKDGVIYFSMGSNLKSKDLPDEVKVNLLKMFGSLKQTVLWKFEEVLPNLPKNVHILEWAPQQAILAHPNLVVFITHGGLLSTTESIHFGVPIIGIPVFGDQFMNIEKSINKGFAQRVDLSYTMPDELKKKIVEVIGNKRYSEKAKELSLIYHDRPVKPGQELVHWVNHVIKTRGAPHLRSPAADLPFYKRKFLDLAALIAVLLLAVYILLKRACTFVCSQVCSKKGKTGSKKNN